MRFVPVTAEDVGTGFSRPDAKVRLEADPTFPRPRVLTVVSPGLFTTVQDRGRWGHQASGVPIAGAMDIVSHDAANTAVGNDPHAATLEVTIAGPELRFEQPTWVVVTGADLNASLDGATLRTGEPRSASAGSILGFGQRRRGARAYVGVDGGIATPLVLGSRATHVAGGLGRALRAGDRLALGTQAEVRPRSIPQPRLPAGGGRLRIWPGPQRDYFAQATLDLLHRSRFEVGAQSNRMAYRLVGPRLSQRAVPEMISDATFTGGIQVTPAGELILLMADRQTTGGYPQIAVVVSADLPLAGQLAPGDWLEFEAAG